MISGCFRDRLIIIKRIHHDNFINAFNTSFNLILIIHFIILIFFLLFIICFLLSIHLPLVINWPFYLLLLYLPLFCPSYYVLILFCYLFIIFVLFPIFSSFHYLFYIRVLRLLMSLLLFSIDFIYSWYPF